MKSESFAVRPTRGGRFVGAPRTRGAILFATVALVALSAPALANGFGESRPWQFETTADMVNRAYLADLIERKKGGFYDSFNPTYVTNNTNTTNIEHQVNCSVTSTALGNSGANAMDAVASSPTVTTTGNTTASTVGNTAENGLSDHYGPGGVVLAANTANGNSPTGALINNDQNNDGSTLSADVTGSTTNTTTGPVNVGDGQTSQVLNSAQDNLGDQTSTINDSTACNLTAGEVSSGPIN